MITGNVIGAQCAQQCLGQEPPIKRVLTVKEHLQQRTDNARVVLERCLILQAKAEVAGIHNFPADDLREFLGWS